MVPMDIPVPRRQRGGNPQFHLETSIQPCIWPITEERHLGIFFLALILYSGLHRLLSPDKAFPKYSDGRDTTKNTDRSTPKSAFTYHSQKHSFLTSGTGWMPSIPEAGSLTTGVCCKAISKLHEALRGQCKAGLVPCHPQREDMSTTATLIFQDDRSLHDFYLLQFSEGNLLFSVL